MAYALAVMAQRGPAICSQQPWRRAEHRQYVCLSVLRGERRHCPPGAGHAAVQINLSDIALANPLAPVPARCCLRNPDEELSAGCRHLARRTPLKSPAAAQALAMKLTSKSITTRSVPLSPGPYMAVIAPGALCRPTVCCRTSLGNLDAMCPQPLRVKPSAFPEQHPDGTAPRRYTY